MPLYLVVPTCFDHSAPLPVASRYQYQCQWLGLSVFAPVLASASALCAQEINFEQSAKEIKEDNQHLSASQLNLSPPVHSDELMMII